MTRQSMRCERVGRDHARECSTNRRQWRRLAPIK
jgi:hypothetical protein